MIRQATEEEITFYHTVLYPLQDMIFPLIQDERFYLTGGTCLARFFYHHRFSDDLDFFFDGYAHDFEAFDIAVRNIANRISAEFALEMTVNGEYFKRFFVTHQAHPLKLEFVYENYKTIGTRTQASGILIDSKENIAANKLAAAQDRKTTKDFIDLYFLLNDLPVEQVVEWARTKVVPLDYEGLSIAFQDTRLEGNVLLQTSFAEHDLERFVHGLLNTLFAAARDRR